jgi:hypothetical protein
LERNNKKVSPSTVITDIQIYIKSLGYSTDGATYVRAKGRKRKIIVAERYLEKRFRSKNNPGSDMIVQSLSIGHGLAN